MQQLSQVFAAPSLGTAAIVEEIEAEKRGIRCAVYCKLLKLTLVKPTEES